ncbi:MAG: DivIVA domain-containing protein, partial [Desulfurivibrio sp.]
MLTVQDIQAKQFHVRFRGFDQGEVDEFLEQVAAALQGANYENSILKEQVAAAERKVAAYKQQEKSSMNAILSAQKVAEEMKEKARAEAQALLSKARQEARELEESAGREISGLEREVDQLRAKKSQVREELRLVLESYLSQLDRDQAAPSTADAGTVAFGGPDSSAPTPAESPAMGDDLYQQIELSDDMLTPTM